MPYHYHPFSKPITAWFYSDFGRPCARPNVAKRNGTPNVALKPEPRTCNVVAPRYVL